MDSSHWISTFNNNFRFSNLIGCIWMSNTGFRNVELDTAFITDCYCLSLVRIWSCFYVLCILISLWWCLILYSYRWLGPVILSKYIINFRWLNLYSIQYTKHGTVIIILSGTINLFRLRKYIFLLNCSSFRFFWVVFTSTSSGLIDQFIYGIRKEISILLLFFNCTHIVFRFDLSINCPIWLF